MSGPEYMTDEFTRQTVALERIADALDLYIDYALAAAQVATTGPDIEDPRKMLDDLRALVILFIAQRKNR